MCEITTVNKKMLYVPEFHPQSGESESQDF